MEIRLGEALPHQKPFRRNFRAMKQHPNAGYSSWAYIIDPDYARDPSHFVRAFMLIQNDLKHLFEFVEPSDEGAGAYSYRLHALLMRACIEVEANFKAIFAENIFSKARPSMPDYRRIDVTHRLSSYEVLLPIWSPGPKILKPFGAWKSGAGLTWYQAYNASKHNRHEAFKEASLENVVSAVAGLLVIISAQFRDESFEPTERALGLGGYDYHAMEAATGSLFRIQYPDDWTDDEMYAFDWTDLKTEADRFAKIDYDAIPI